MLSEVGSSKGRSYAVEAPHTRLHNLKSKHEFPPQTQPVQRTRSSWRKAESSPRYRFESVAASGAAPRKSHRIRGQSAGWKPARWLSTIEPPHALRPHSRTAPALLIGPLSFRTGESRGGIRCPLRNSTPKYIDVHRYTYPLERSHQPHRNPQRRRNRDPPLRRIPIRRPLFISEGARSGRARLQSCRQHARKRNQGFSP